MVVAAAKMAVDKEALDNLQQEVVSQITSHINARHEELFLSLRAEIHGVYKMLHQQNGIHVQRAADTEGIFDFCRDGEEVIDDTLPPLCGQFCINQKDLEPIVPSSSVHWSELTHDEENEKVAPPTHQKTPTHKNKVPARNTDLAVLPVTQPDLKPEPPVSSGPDPNKPLGSFAGRQNLFAFLQAKNWDSEYCQFPERQFTKKMSTLSLDQAERNKLYNRYKSAINSQTFDLAIGFIIVVNAIVMGLELEYQAMQSAELIGLEPDEGNWPNAEDAFLALNHVFTVLYTIEFLLRISAMGCGYFKLKLNWIDFIIVVTSVLELYLLPAADVESPDMALVRLLRVMRLSRVLRIVRMLKFFARLRMLVVAVTHALGSLFWSMCLLSVIMLIASIFMTQSLQSYLQNEVEDPVKREKVYIHFGSWARSCITIFEMTFSIGTWGRCGRTVIFNVSRYYAVFFLCYLGLVSFGMIRVIAAIFLKDTLTSATKEGDLTMAEQFTDSEYVVTIFEVFQEMDKDGDGEVSLQEMHWVCKDGENKGLAKKIRDGLGIVPHEMPGLFTLMDDGDNSISFCEFLTGVMRMKNEARHKVVDLATLLYENKKLLKRVLTIKDAVDKLREDFDESNRQQE